MSGTGKGIKISYTNFFNKNPVKPKTSLYIFIDLQVIWISAFGESPKEERSLKKDFFYK